MSHVHSHSHSHGHPHVHAHGSAAGDGPSEASRLRTALLVTSSVLLLEVVGGVLTHSVALLADAGHMLTDAGSLAIALLAARVSAKPRDARRSYGYGRTEVLAALANGLLLGGVSVGIVIESIDRLSDPRAVDAGPMIGVAVIGLIANLVSARVLQPAAHHSLNMRAAFWHVLGDALGSALVIVAGLGILLWDWSSADALGGIAIALLLVWSAFGLVRDSLDILLEGTPRHLDLEEIAGRARALPGVRSIHDLHIWTVSSGFTAMSAHVDLGEGADAEHVRRAVHRLLHEQYAIEHTTIQTEAAPALLSIDDGPPDPDSTPAGCTGGERHERGRFPEL